MSLKKPLERGNVLGVGVSAINLDLAVRQIQEWIADGEHTCVSLTPAHAIMDCYYDSRLRSIVNASGLIAPDGMPVVWLLRYQGFPYVSRVYGPDLVRAVCSHSQETGWKHFFYGGKPGVAEKLMAIMAREFPCLRTAGSFSPPFREKLDRIPDPEIQLINESEPDIVWIGLGSPKQEYWMAHARDRLNASVLIGVGAAFDFLSGEKRQAPYIIQRSGFEWVYRLMQEPGRLAKRYSRYPLFCWLVLNQILGWREYLIDESKPDGHVE